ncbi:mCG1026194, isoform CRA_a, partial [Mus musculus]
KRSPKLRATLRARFPFPCRGRGEGERTLECRGVLTSESRARIALQPFHNPLHPPSREGSSRTSVARGEEHWRSPAGAEAWDCRTARGTWGGQCPPQSLPRPASPRPALCRGLLAGARANDRSHSAQLQRITRRPAAPVPKAPGGAEGRDLRESF